MPGGSAVTPQAGPGAGPARGAGGRGAKQAGKCVGLNLLYVVQSGWLGRLKRPALPRPPPNSGQAATLPAHLSAPGPLHAAPCTQPAAGIVPRCPLSPLIILFLHTLGGGLLEPLPVALRAQDARGVQLPPLPGVRYVAEPLAPQPVRVPSLCRRVHLRACVCGTVHMWACVVK